MPEKVEDYLRDTLGLEARVGTWPQARALPYFLQDAFDLRGLSILGTKVLLASDRHPGGRPLAEVRDRLDELRRAAGLPVLYVADALASWERKRLVLQKVPFLVPGNQLYLPDLGIDLREYFRPRPGLREAPLSPATQAMLIAALLRRPWTGALEQADLGRGIGYTAMTRSRAARELVAAGLASAETRARTRWLRFLHGPAATWEQAQPLLRDPVKRRVWAPSPPRSRPRRPPHAGLDALARLTMLAEPRWPVHAVGPRQWRDAVAAGVEFLPEPFPGCSEWEVWHHDPVAVPDGETVDVLSLLLSLRGSQDERVQIALEELKGRFGW